MRNEILDMKVIVRSCLPSQRREIRQFNANEKSSQMNFCQTLHFRDVIDKTNLFLDIEILIKKLTVSGMKFKRPSMSFPSLH